MVAGINVTTLDHFTRQQHGYTGTNDDLINVLISTVSTAFEKYINRHLKQMSRTEYFDVINSNVHDPEFFPKGIPIITAAVYYDQDRVFSAGTEVGSAYVILNNQDRIITIDDYYMSKGRRVVKIIYTGGFATSTSNVTLVMKAGGTGTYAAGDWARVCSDALGTVVSWDAVTHELVVTPRSPTGSSNSTPEKGEFNVKDVVHGDPTGGLWTIDSFNTSNLIYDYPDLAFAANLQIQFAMQTKDHPGRTDVSIGDVSASIIKAAKLAPEVRETLKQYRQVAI